MSLAHTIRRIVNDRLLPASGEENSILVDTPDWFIWLESVTTFAFTSPAGNFTARKEARARGGSYWKAYKTAQGILHRAYLGKSSDLTLDRLRHVAGTIAGAPASAATDSDIDADADAATSTATPPTRARITPVTPVTPVATAPLSSVFSANLPINLRATKITLPPARAQLVIRPRLFERLDTGLRGKLTLIAAPAGFGKTTLLSAWRTTTTDCDLSLAWVSLDAGDNDPLLFWSYVCAALDAALPGAGIQALTYIQSPQAPPIEHILTGVLDAVSILASEKPGCSVALVLEDYHVITAPAIHAALAWLLDALPPTLHLVIVTRADPNLPLARLRVSGDLTELHADDLRFTPEEARAFLNQIMGLELATGDLAALEVRTEGWIAGLQLAALALRDHRDHAGFIRTFSGNNRYIVDYLAAEVLERQPARVKTFLLYTSILERMCGPLCDALLDPLTSVEAHAAGPERATAAIPDIPQMSLSHLPVTGDTSSQSVLEELERANLFVVPLDEERVWYRYHHLFADLLRQRLARSAAKSAVSELHARASLWYEQQGLVADAVQHALAMESSSRAVQLIERHGLGVIVAGQVQTALGWLSKLPEELLRARPMLCIAHALALLFTNNLQAAEARLNDADSCIRPDTTPVEAQSIQGYAAAIRANMALYTGDLPGCVAWGEQVLSMLPESEIIARTTARLHVARAYRVTGDVTGAAERRAVAALEPIRATGSLFGTLGAVANLALFQEMQGRLRAAVATYRQLDQIITSPDDHQGPIGLYSSPAYYVGLGDVHREWNELSVAHEYLAQAMERLPNTLAVDAHYVACGYITQARLQHARGEYAAAQKTLATYADLAQQRGFMPHLVTRSAAVQAQFALSTGNLAAATAWADGSGLHADDEIMFTRETEYLVLARVWIAQANSGLAGGLLSQALSLLDRLMADATAKARTSSVLEILIVKALALQAQGNLPDALIALVSALDRGAPEGYIRRFVDEGPAMLRLLQAVDPQAVSRWPGYVSQIIAAFSGEQRGRGGTNIPVDTYGKPAPTSATHRVALEEPLSERELDVLRLIAIGHTNAEVAQALVIALSTVKSHINSILGKLGVTNRTQAVARAHDLSLI